ncbi:kinase suppressor of Ras 2-like isoform X3 [Homarus americanus]|uniref:kinase suppressor of Ras 2-like isoform X3 n=1 Tax=Homarus americanus TaxID=6706 RepID=UPI001C494455|nr:kinase suppressor of Ras 2-like isoform X3 [Homarus americanus]
MSWGSGGGRLVVGAFHGEREGHQQQQVGGGGDVDEVIQRALETCETHHQFIASQAEHLERLRSQCATSAQLTQQEIRTLEGKLVKLFSLQLVTKRHLPTGVPLPLELQLYPSLKQWLQVVGLCKDSVNGMCQRVSTLEGLLEKRENELRNILSDYGADRSEAHKLARAMHNLKRYTDGVTRLTPLDWREGYFTSRAEIQMQGQGGDWGSSELPLYWDSWERSCPPSPRPSHRTQRECRSSVSSSDGDGGSVTSGSTSGGAWSGDGSRTSGRGVPISQRSSDDSSTPSSPPPPFSSVPPLSPGGPFHVTSNLTLSGSGSVFSEKRYTPPPTPNIIPKGKSSGDKKFPTTPPPGKKYQTCLLNPMPPLGRSTSHESQLAPRAEGHEQQSSTLLSHFLLRRKLNNFWVGGSMEQLGTRRTRLHSESEASGTVDNTGKRPDGSRSRTDMRELRTAQNSPAPSTLASPIKSPNYPEAAEEENYTNKCTLGVPKSPRTPTLPGSMVHNVQHRFIKTIKSATCGYCHHKFTILSGSLKCKECSFKCHRECEPKVPPSCGLPHEFLQIFTDSLKKGGMDGSGGLPSRGTPGVSLSHLNDVFPPPLRDSPMFSSQPSINIPSFQGPDSSSNTSSCNSSTPSSPAPIISASPAQQQAFRFPVTRGFHFPDFTFFTDVNDDTGDIPLEMRPLTHISARSLPKVPVSSSSTHSDVIDSRQSHDSDRTVSQTSGSGSTGTDDSERTIAGRVDSQDSTVSDGENADPRCFRQNSVSSVSQSLREWDIPYDELDRGEVIGRGRFGIVYSGNWHGHVAIKELRMDYVNDEKTLEAFKAEVSTFRKTRHENLVLFMGACMKPPRLAIVTSLCKGRTLYTHIHVQKDKFNMSKTIMIAQQISQGMGYLHARGIVHKDLKTKNIFLESGKVVITDFGLFNVTRLCHDTRRGNWLSIPPGWLCYLSPEVMRNLRVAQKQDDGLPFTTYSDVYGFGTVWYELLCGEWPHKGLPPEAIIWQVGRGMKPSLANLQASRDVKDILMACWSYRPDERPEFSTMQANLNKLPKKRLHRSPSHPIHLSRSAESVF